MAKDLKKVVTQLKGAVVAHGKQAKTIEKHIKDMGDGPSFFFGLRDKLKRDKNNQQEISENKGKFGQVPDLRGGVTGMFKKSMDPNSNGTGSARPNFGQFAQNAIGNVMGGQKMGNALGFRQGVNDKLDKVLQAVQGDASGNDTPQTPLGMAGTPPADPMTNQPASMPDGSNDDAANSAMMNMDGAMMAAKPKQIAKAKAKAYADKKGIRGKARKELVKDAKRSQSFDAEAQDEKSGDKAVNFGSSMHIDPPKEKAMKRDGTKVLSNQVKFPSSFAKLSQGMIAEGAAEGLANAGKMAYSQKKEKLKPAKMAYSKKMEKLKPAKSAYPLAQSISLDKKDTVSYELRPGKTTMENIGTNSDGTPNIVPSTTYSKKVISNKDYANRMKKPVAKNRMKQGFKTSKTKIKS
jgi:hypothetical protein